VNHSVWGDKKNSRGGTACAEGTSLMKGTAYSSEKKEG